MTGGTLTRRRLLTAAAATGAAGLAGCLGTDGSGVTWTQHQGDGGNSGSIPGSAPGPSGTLETMTSGLAPQLRQYQPRTDGDRVYVASGHARTEGDPGRVTVRAFATDGSSEWEQEVTVEEADPNAGPRSLSVASGRVVVPTKRELVGLDAASGTVEWRLDRDWAATPAVHDGTVYGGGDGAWGVSAEDGTEQWSTELESLDTSGAIPSSVVQAVDGERVYFASADGLAAAPIDGEEPDWHYRPTPDESEYEDSVPGFLYAPAVVDGTVYAARTTVFYDGVSGWVVALDAATGERKWRFRAGEGLVVSSAPVVVDGTVYVGSSATRSSDRDEGTVHAIDPGSGTEQWRVDVPRQLVRGYPAAVGDRLYLPLDRVHAVHTGDQDVETFDFGLGKGLGILTREIASDGESLFLTDQRDLVAYRPG